MSYWHSLAPGVQQQNLHSKPHLSVGHTALLQCGEDVSEAGALRVALLAASVAVALCGQLLNEVIAGSTVSAAQELLGRGGGGGGGGGGGP